MNALLTKKYFCWECFSMTKIHSINPNQLYIVQNAEVSLKLAGNTAQVTFTANKNKKCPIKINPNNCKWITLTYREEMTD